MIRTDLAVELRQNATDLSGISYNEKNMYGIMVNETVIKTKEAAKRLGKPCGRYITLPLTPFDTDAVKATAEVLRELVSDGSVLVVGLGNRKITPDALGPATAERIFATRHIGKEVSESLGLGSLRSVSVLTPSVLGVTGLEAAEQVSAAAEIVKPETVIVIDALATALPENIGRSLQISDTGISPGAGVGNRRQRIGSETLGIKTVAIGVPTVSDLKSFTDKNGIITSKDIDEIIDRTAKVLAEAINLCLQPELEPEVVAQLI